MPRLENGPASALRAHSSMRSPRAPGIVAGSPIAIRIMHSPLERPHRTRHKIDIPPGLNPNGCSVLRRSPRHASPKGLPGPFYILGGVVVTMQVRATVWATVPADRQALPDHDATARASLTRERRMDRLHLLPSVCCFES